MEEIMSETEEIKTTKRNYTIYAKNFKYLYKIMIVI